MENAAAQVAEAQPDMPVRRKRAAVGGASLKLAAPEIPGYRLRWANDQKNRLAELHELGYRFVDAGGIATHGPGSRINRLAGTQDGGAPLKTYLMKTPEALWQQGVDEKEEARAGFDQAISEGRDPSGETDPGHSYVPGEARHSRITVERG